MKLVPWIPSFAEIIIANQFQRPVKEGKLQAVSARHEILRNKESM